MNTKQAIRAVKAAGATERTARNYAAVLESVAYDIARGNGPYVSRTGDGLPQRASGWSIDDRARFLDLSPRLVKRALAWLTTAGLVLRERAKSSHRGGVLSVYSIGPLGVCSNGPVEVYSNGPLAVRSYRDTTKDTIKNTTKGREDAPPETFAENCDPGAVSENGSDPEAHPGLTSAPGCEHTSASIHQEGEPMKASEVVALATGTVNASMKARATGDKPGDLERAWKLAMHEAGEAHPFVWHVWQSKSWAALCKSAGLEGQAALVLGTVVSRWSQFMTFAKANGEWRSIGLIGAAKYLDTAEGRSYACAFYANLNANVQTPAPEQGKPTVGKAVSVADMLKGTG